MFNLFRNKLSLAIVILLNLFTQTGFFKSSLTRKSHMSGSRVNGVLNQRFASLALLVLPRYFLRIADVATASASYNDVTEFEVVELTRLGARNKRDLSTRKVKNKGEHIDDIRYEFYGDNRHFTLHLFKNKYFIAPSFVTIYQNPDGTDEVIKGFENCYYEGHLGDSNTSTVVVQTCDGIKGLLKTENNEEYFIEPHEKHLNASSNYSGKHVLYKMKDIKTNKTKCGHDYHHGDSINNNGMIDFTDHDENMSKNKIHLSRKRRFANSINFFEVIPVLDSRQFNKYGKNKELTARRGVDVLHYVDAVYKTMNTRVVVIGVVVWTGVDKSAVSANVGETLSSFRQYTETILHKSFKLNPDNAQLLTAIDFDGDVVGLAGVGTLCSPSSCAVNQDHASNAAVSANTIAHEMGHNVGFYHNQNNCKCPNPPCVMDAYVANSQAKGFSTCVQNVFSEKVNTGQLPCIFNYPDKIYGDPKCGDGFKEGTEECDCGSVEECNKSGLSKCCDATTCKLRDGAACADGDCCEGCQLKSQGRLCRDKFNEECDLQEYCTGESSVCPKNIYVNDGVSCSNGEAVCYKGFCMTHTSQCKILWGPNSIRSWDVCFQENTKPNNEWGNCGQDKTDKYIACSKFDQFCGKLQCRSKSSSEPMSALPILGSNKKSKGVTYYIGKQAFDCWTGVTSLGADLDDPTMARDGTKCAEDFICMGGKCTNVSTLSFTRCKDQCHNGGVCNSNGNCHCPPGYACPYCKYAGAGGSIDSGQGCIDINGCGNTGSGNGCLSPLVKGMLFLFLLILPLLALTSYICYRYRNQIRHHWQTRRQKQAKQRTRATKAATGSSQTATTVSENPYYTNSSNFSTANLTHSKQKEIKIKIAPSPRHSPSSKRPGLKEKKHYSPVSQPKFDKLDTQLNKNPSDSRNSPRPGKLPQIAIYNKMDKQVKQTR